MKPDWKDAPEWANFLAQDRSGAWWWFEFQPESQERMGVWLPIAGKCSCATEAHIHWEESVERRP